MPDETNIGTPETISDSGVESPTLANQDIPDYDLSFGYNQAGERTVNVIKPPQSSEPSETPTSTSENLDRSPADNWQKRYTDAQSYNTKIAQENAQLRERITVANRDIEHLISVVQAQQGNQNPNQRRGMTPEEWSETVNSQERFNGYLTGPFTASLLQAVQSMIQENQQTNPVYRESAYRSDLERLVAHSETEGVNIRALKPELLALMSANNNLHFFKAYELAKEWAKSNGKNILLGTSPQQALKEKAARLNIETNRASGQLGRQPAKIRTGSRREMLEDSLNQALQEAGLL